MNRVTLVLPVLLGSALIGCGRKETASSAPPTNAPAASGNPLTAPADYLGAVSKAKKVSEKAIDTAYLNQTVQLFQATEGRLPKDLNELVAEKYLPRLPEAPYGMKIVYNAANGQVTVVRQ